jgi:hypothetical protein
MKNQVFVQSLDRLLVGLNIHQVKDLIEMKTRSDLNLVI